MNNLPQRKKSPRAPSISLEDAIDRVQKIYERERLHAAPTDVVAQHLGYKGVNNGAALSALANVRYFGLVERPREGYLSVVKDFERFKYAPDNDQRRTLLIGFLRKPPLYAELLDKYERGLPSDPNLRFELIELGFNAATVEAALVAFRSSVEYADYYTSVATITESAPVEFEDEWNTEPVPAEPRIAVTMNSKAASVADMQGRPEVSEHIDKIPVRLSGGRRAWLMIPAPFFESDKARLKAQIDLLLTDDEQTE